MRTGIKRCAALLAAAALVLSCAAGAAAEDTARRILSLIEQNPAARQPSSDSMSVMDEDELKLSEIKRVSGLYAVSSEIVSLSAQMSAKDYGVIEEEVNRYIYEVAAADESLDTSGMSGTAEYKELVSNRTVLNEAIDAQPPQIVRVDAIYPGEDFWVRVHVMYKSEKDRSFSLTLVNYTTGETVMTKGAVIYAGSYNCDVKMSAAGCSSGDKVSVTVIYRGVTCSVLEECTFSGVVKGGAATEPPAQSPTPLAASERPAATEEPGEEETEPNKSLGAASAGSRILASGISSWSNGEVTAAIDLGLVPWELQGGYTEYISREGFCRLAARAIEKYTGMPITEYAAKYGTNEASFTDTSEEFINACAVLGIVNGYDDATFRPYYVITREQAAAMLARCARKLGLSDKPGIFIFNDNGSISGWARGHVRYVRANEIMNGDDDNNFMPHMSYTVEQAIVTFYRMYNKVIAQGAA